MFCFALCLLATPARAADPIAGYDPARVALVGSTYARYHVDLRRAFAAAATAASAPVTVASTKEERRQLGFHFSNVVDDAVRERIVATLSNGDGARAAELQKLFAHGEFLDQATQAIRVLGMRETDLADVVSALVIAGYNASHPVALTAAQGFAVSRALRPVVLASPALATLDDPTKQTIVSEMSYQILFWEADASTFGYGQDSASLARLRTSIAGSLSSLGITLAALRTSDAGLTAGETQSR